MIFKSRTQHCSDKTKQKGQLMSYKQYTEEELQQKARNAIDFGDFITSITDDTFVPIYRNQLADEWRDKYLKVFVREGFHHTPSADIFKEERHLKYAYQEKHELTYSRMAATEISMRQMMTDLYGERYVELYEALALTNSIEVYIMNRYNELKNENNK